VSTTTATVQYIMAKILQKYTNFSFYHTVYIAHNENKIQDPDIDMCIGEPLVWMTSYFYCKKLSSDKEQPLIRAGFAIPEGALLRGFHCISRKAKHRQNFFIFYIHCYSHIFSGEGRGGSNLRRSWNTSRSTATSYSSACSTPRRDQAISEI